EIRAGDVDLRPEEFSGVDGFLDLQIGVWLIRTGGAYGGDAGGEEEARKTERHVVGEVCVVDGRGDVKKVIVHADDAGNGGVSRKVDALSVLRNLHGGCVADRGDSVVGEENGLVGAGLRASAVDDLEVFESDDRRVHADEL